MNKGNLFFLAFAVIIVAGCTQYLPAAGSKQCGLVVTHGTDPAFSRDANQAEDCFWDNYQSCAPAQINLTYFGVDSGENLYFNAVNVSGKCLLSGYSQSYSANFGGNMGNKIQFSCETLTKDQDGLHVIGCNFGNGPTDVLIPVYKSV